jgi:NAD(P)-dependent dehydrogenase (short-subunit alcohol dehydrogenase family)
MFQDKVVIVTGGGSGMGAAAAHRFAQEGAAVCVADRNEAAAEAVVQGMKAAGGAAFACTVDIATAEGNSRMFEETLERYGKVDVAFLNAGYMGGIVPFEDQTQAFFETIVQINLVGLFLGLKQAYAVLPPGGAVVVTASTAGTGGTLINPAYVAAKHGAVGLVKSSSHAFGQKGIRLNAILPGRVRTAMNEADDLTPLTVDTVDPESLQVVPYLGEASPQHVAEIALFLASPRANYINGALITADAGMTAMMIPPRS